MNATTPTTSASAAAANGAPGRCSGASGAFAAENRCVIVNGVTIAVKLTMPPIAPCSSPCAFAGTARDSIARTEGMVRPSSAANGTATNSIAGVDARA